MTLNEDLVRINLPTGTYTAPWPVNNHQGRLASTVNNGRPHHHQSHKMSHEMKQNTDHIHRGTSQKKVISAGVSRPRTTKEDGILKSDSSTQACHLSLRPEAAVLGRTCVHEPKFQ